ncbi:type II toxin-antitoxin system RatA family toxin [Undibacterium fentianense]|uniref:Type II toxin-antitoxin system RatA family toxin n=1 Tax=Undibacterium fentianense TaxID=2828728 RepID=A0A941DZN9_9BURK|nr:type II toxin-antitoxin system RatA family toxin [Undibacterium fentianense]MBR7798621.1 type II toxin-antitoxin system RatA family toxin [Undibacterium fentianense]
MAVVQKNVLVHYSVEQMFALVEKVEDYPLFLPWCGGVHVAERSEQTLKATLSINYHGIKQSFTTQNLNKPPHTMEMTLVDGPFKQLHGVWTFTSLRSDACKIEFHLRYEFSSKLLEHLIGPVFGKITNSFVDAFCSRADHVYGQKP